MSLGKGKYIFGTAKVGERGQIVIPKEAREIFNINAGDVVLIVGDDKKGIAISKPSMLEELAAKLIRSDDENE